MDADDRVASSRWPVPATHRLGKATGSGYSRMGPTRMMTGWRRSHGPEDGSISTTIYSRTTLPVRGSPTRSPRRRAKV
jgi:DsbC/DsbD-like thiol-disulfide interchange protein